MNENEISEVETTEHALTDCSFKVVGRQKHNFIFDIWIKEIQKRAEHVFRLRTTGLPADRKKWRKNYWNNEEISDVNTNALTVCWYNVGRSTDAGKIVKKWIK